MKLHHRTGLGALALIASAAALQIEPAAVRNLVVEHDGGRLSIGSVRAPLWSAAFAQSADSFTLENVKFTFGTATYELKRIELSGVTSSRADIEALLAPNASEPMMRRLARINAKQIRIPEARVTQTIGKDSQDLTYRDLTLSNVVSGRVESMTIESVAGEIANDRTKGQVSAGRSSVSEMDMQALAALYETKAEGASAPLSRIYGAFSLDNFTYIDAKEGVAVTVARISGKDFLARPTKDSWNGTAALLTELDKKEELSAEENARVLQAAADILGAFDIGQLEAAGIEIKPPRNKSDAVGSGRIARIAYTNANGSRPADARMEGFEFSDKDARVKIGSVSLTGFSFAPTLEGLKALEGKSLDKLDHAALRGLIPTLGTLRITDFDVDAPATDDEPTDRVRMTFASMEITADKPRNGIPTNIRFEQRNASLKFAENSTEELAQQLRALGYKSLDSSSVVAATWNEASNEITITEFSLDGKDMGSVRVTGLIGNVSPDLFSADEGAASAALLNSKAKSASVVIENWGLLDRYIETTAKEEGTTPDALKKMYAGGAPLVLSSMIGNSDQSKVLGQAIARFIEKPKKLTIEAQPKSASGFGIMDVMLASDPKAMLAKLNVKAKAE